MGQYTLKDVQVLVDGVVVAGHADPSFPKQSVIQPIQYRDCRACDGRGKVATISGRKTCQQCGGFGKHPLLPFKPPREKK